MVDVAVQLDSEKAYLSEAKALRLAGATEEALKLLEEAEGKFGCTPKILCTRGSVFRVCGRYEEAHQCFDAALAIEPDNEVVINAKSQAYLCEGRDNEAQIDFPAATRCFDKALGLTPRSEFALNTKGQACLRQWRLDDARECFETAIGINPRSEFAINSLGQVCFVEGELEEAHRLFDSVLRMNPKNEFTLNAKAQIYMKKNDFVNARKYFEMVLELDPKNPVATYFVAKLLFMQGKTPEAQKMIRVRLQQAPFNKAALMLFALCTNQNDPAWSAFVEIFGRDIVDEAMTVYKYGGVSVYEEAAALFESRSFGQNNLWSGLHALRPVDGLAAEVAGEKRT